MFPFGYFGYEYWLRPYFTDGGFSGVVDFVRVGKSKNVADLRNGRFCSVTGVWSPGHRIRYVWGRPVRRDIPYEPVMDAHLLEMEQLVQLLAGGAG